MVNAGELSDKGCEIADAPVSLKSDVWKHFGFAVSRNDKEENAARLLYCRKYLILFLPYWLDMLI